MSNAQKDPLIGILKNPVPHPDILNRDTNWLVDMLTSAFYKRYNEKGEDDPRAPERIEEMGEALFTINLAVYQWFEAEAVEELEPLLNTFSSRLNDLIELDRNANRMEVNAARQSMLELTSKMYELLKTAIERYLTTA